MSSWKVPACIIVLDSGSDSDEGMKVFKEPAGEPVDDDDGRVVNQKDSSMPLLSPQPVDLYDDEEDVKVFKEPAGEPSMPLLSPQPVDLYHDEEEEDVKVIIAAGDEPVDDDKVRNKKDSSMPMPLPPQQLVDLYDGDDEFLGIGVDKHSDLDIMTIIKPNTLIKTEQEVGGETLQLAADQTVPSTETVTITSKDNVGHSESQTAGNIKASFCIS
jgi:hypothetical protein